MVAQAVTEHALPHQAVQLVLESMRELTPIARQLDRGSCFCCGIGPDFFLKQLELVEDAVQGGHVCLGLSLKTMNTCLLFTSPYLHTVGDGDGHTLFNTSLVLITVPDD